MSDWLIRHTGPPRGTLAAAVQDAWIELGHAAQSGDPRRQQAAWEAIWTAAAAAGAGDVILALARVEQSHRGGPLTYEQAMHQLTIAVYELKHWRTPVGPRDTQTDEPDPEIWQAIVDRLSTHAGPNSAQVEWLFVRLGSWSAADWRTLAVSLIPRGLVARAVQAFEVMGDEAARAGASQSLKEWGELAWSAGRFFYQLHQRAMIQGVGDAIREHMHPQTREEAAELLQVGYDAVKDTVLRAGVALAARPLISPQTFEALWAPFEDALGLLRAERGTS
jgi:hypothetical protein